MFINQPGKCAFSSQNMSVHHHDQLLPPGSQIRQNNNNNNNNPLKFALLPTCGFVAQLVERPTSIWEARVQAPSKPEFFQASFSAISLIAVYLRGSIRYLSPAGLI